MLSNRESARRSRRKKQAHLGELQIKVHQLQDENARLLQKLHALHASFDGVMRRNRVVKQNTAYLRAHLLSGEPCTSDVLEAATVAMNAGAHAEQMLRVMAAGNALPASLLTGAPGGDASGTPAALGDFLSSVSMNALSTVAMGYGAAANGVPVGMAQRSTTSSASAAVLGAGPRRAPLFASLCSGPFAADGGGVSARVGHVERGQTGAPRGRATNFPLRATAERGGGRGGSETSSLTYQPHCFGGVSDAGPSRAGALASGRSNRGSSPGLSMHSVGAHSAAVKTYANAVRRAEDSNAALVGAVAEHLSIPSRGGGSAATQRLRFSDVAGTPSANLGQREAALAEAVAAQISADAAGEDARRSGPNAAAGGGRDFDLPEAASAAAAAAAAARRGCTAQQGSDGSRADAGSGNSVDGGDVAGGEFGDLGAQSADLGFGATGLDSERDDVPRELTRDFLLGSSPLFEPALEPAAPHSGFAGLGLDGADNWFLERGVDDEDDAGGAKERRSAARASKMGRTESMNRVASMERLAKRSAIVVDEGETAFFARDERWCD
jgi:hypothetical protein